MCATNNKSDILEKVMKSLGDTLFSEELKIFLLHLLLIHKVKTQCWMSVYWIYHFSRLASENSDLNIFDYKLQSISEEKVSKLY